MHKIHKHIMFVVPLFFKPVKSTFQALFKENCQFSKQTEQGKSEGLDNCDRPSNLTQIRFKSSIFQPGWPWNLTDDLQKQ